MRHVWVIGAGGLLGRALLHQAAIGGDMVFTPQQKFLWSDRMRLLEQLAGAVTQFGNSIGPDDVWEIYWSAGIGTLASGADDLLREAEALAGFLSFLERHPVLRAVPGAFGFASSAGAIYAGAGDDVVTEQTAVAPTTPYAYAKLEQEAMVRGFCERQSGVRSFAARITTLYGVGQAPGKKQGLLTHVARCIVRNKPIQIFVPFDTIRDYISAADAAVRMMMVLRQDRHLHHFTQIIASEVPVTIAEIIATFKRVARRTPHVVTGVSHNTALYKRRVQFHSLAARGPESWPSTSLLVGIGQLLQAERSQFALPGLK